MNVLILGGTGFVGSPIAECLNRAGARVSILCRSDVSAEKAESLYASPIRGDIEQPEVWLSKVKTCDAVIHCACTFGEDMADLDARLCDALIEGFSQRRSRKTVIYTGGTWLYPDSQGEPMDEKTPFSPVESFEWMVDGTNKIQSCNDIRGITIHPAVVVDDPDGIPDFLHDDFSRTGELAIPFSTDLQWPLVHNLELAEAYFCVLEKAIAGESYNAASIEAASVAELVKSLGKRHGDTTTPEVKPYEYWAENYGHVEGRQLSQRLVSDKLREQLGWQPDILPSATSD